MRLKLAILILSYSGWVRPTEAGPISTDSKSSAFYYLLNYGYIKKSDNQDTAQILSEEAVTKAIKDFQVNFRHFFPRCDTSIRFIWGYLGNGVSTIIVQSITLKLGGIDLDLLVFYWLISRPEKVPIC